VTIRDLRVRFKGGNMANARAPDAGGRASGDHLVASGAPVFSPVKEPTALFVEGVLKVLKYQI